MSETFYVLMEQGWDYNDEYYFRTEGGHPYKVFTDQDKAQIEADRLNLVEFKRLVNSGEICEYGDDFDYIIDSEKADNDEEIFKECFGYSAYQWWKRRYDREIELKIEPTEEQWLRLMKCFNLQFHEVVTVEKG